jgi:hypothetical protein
MRESLPSGAGNAQHPRKQNRYLPRWWKNEKTETGRASGNPGAHSSPSRHHYGSLARFFDGVAELFYGHARRVAAEGLQLKPGIVVLDVACGTGLNFSHIGARLGAAARTLVELRERRREPAAGLHEADHRGLGGEAVAVEFLGSLREEGAPVYGVLASFA